MYPPLRPRQTTRSTVSFAIVASQYNPDYVQSLVDFAYNEINELQPGAHLTLTWVPGAFEIPLAVKLLARQKKFEAILALGVVLQGATEHGTLIAGSVTDALMRISLEFEVAVIHEVLFVENEQQAVERCMAPEGNRGIEAARASVAIARTLREISAKTA